MIKKYLLFIYIALFCFACKSDKGTIKENEVIPKARVKIPAVQADSAFKFIEKQLSFGVRVPGTDGHAKTKDWIVSKMQAYGAKVNVQEFKANFLSKSNINSYNIIAKINPDHKQRIALFAHWDTRLIAEKDADVTKKNIPIPGAVDGASGVAALIEIARIIHLNPIDLGIDFIFFDAEDQGSEDSSESWCLGSQYWSNSVKNDKEKPEFGILLDLIGANGAVYYKEDYSSKYAPHILTKVWDLANAIGQGNTFVNAPIGAITDDHYYVNSVAGIPTIDIIATQPTGNFGDYHHTHRDNINAIDKTNLAGVIQLVTAVVYKKSDASF
jgi:Zn-dependent M28 family amino/carboxypeptidase